MPTWQPVWTDVTFDHVAAASAADQCEAMAARLRDGISERNRLAAVARDEWTGPYRDEFDTELAALTSGTVDTESRLRALAAAIRRAAAEGTAEQAVRLADRARWSQEKAAEDAAFSHLAPGLAGAAPA